MNKKERIELIKKITVLGVKIDTQNFGIQPVTRLSPFNCYLKPSGKPDVRYAWTSIHDLFKDKQIRFEDQNLQYQIEVTFRK